MTTIVGLFCNSYADSIVTLALQQTLQAIVMIAQCPNEHCRRQCDKYGAINN